jgi:hypothetical protein
MADHFCGPSRSESLYLLTLSIQCMAHAYLCGELQSLIQPVTHSLRYQALGRNKFLSTV